MADHGLTYGALLAGGLLAYGLSGVVGAQAIVYYKLYPDDNGFRKLMVAAIWLLDIAHSGLIAASLIDYFVTFFGVESRINIILPSLAVTIFVTALQTVITQCFFASKMHRANQKSWLITGPILFLIFCRLAAAGVSTVTLLICKEWGHLANRHWIMTVGLALSAGVDAIMTSCLCYSLRKVRKRLGPSESRMLRVVDSLTIYTLENGLLTFLAATTALVAWLKLDQTFITMAIHFLLGKLYANSCLASLNTRKELREMGGHVDQWNQHHPAYPILTGGDFFPSRRLSRENQLFSSVYHRPKLEVNVFQTVKRDSGDMEWMKAYRSPYARREPTGMPWDNRLP
ncbi:hypothetical protein C8J56DRAFT_37117 [Mycena floridula]|nr:hypothetical protein C8J56DRAFT_37117 [Mycena floridula]